MFLSRACKENSLGGEGKRAKGEQIGELTEESCEPIWKGGSNCEQN